MPISIHDEAYTRAINLLQKEFGEDWRSIVQTLGIEDLCVRVGKELTSFMAFPERGNAGSNKWRGNCSPKVIEAVTSYVLGCKRYYRKPTNDFLLLDPMSGSGTSQSVAEHLKIQSVLYDLNPSPTHGKGNWDALTNDVEDSADMIFFHPPYHSIIQYSGSMWGNSHPNDLSRCESYADFIEKLNFVLKKLFLSLRQDGRLAVLVGDIRFNGQFYSIQNDMMRLGEFESFIVKGQYNCGSDSRRYSKPFVPIVTEYLLLLHKQDTLMIPFFYRRFGIFDVTMSASVSLTWHHLIRMTMESMGGRAKLSELNERLREHPKSKKNANYDARIRATIYEHKDQYVNHGNGMYELNYAVA